MSWDDSAQLEFKLSAALDAFNWPEAEEICSGIIERVNTDEDQLPERSAKRLMQSLRRKRRFAVMTQLAEALLRSGLQTPQVRRQYAQALIDQGLLSAAETVLQAIVEDPQSAGAEKSEACGLIGRIYKQLYVDNQDPRSPRNRANLERALAAYLDVYQPNPDGYLWHGINVVALADRARRDKVSLAGLPDAKQLAAAIVKTLDERERQSADEPPAWDEATRMEAYVALGSYKDAADTALRYISNRGADAFEIYSSMRQLIEVWQLKETEQPGNLLLPILKSGHLKKEGATLTSKPSQVLDEAAAVGDAVNELEAIFGPDRMVTLKWYKKGLEQCSSVARVEKRNGRGHGTAWLVNAKDFFSDRSGPLLLTNNHVVSQMPNPRAIFPEDCQINFQVMGEIIEVEDEAVWSSPYNKLDATFLKLKREPKASPLEIYRRPMEKGEPPPRLYIIGHPDGRDLELSLQDNILLDCNDQLLHYRTPTEHGSSGSPVFEPLDWRVVALHHKGSAEMPRLDGTGTYNANEGISILELQRATRR